MPSSMPAREHKLLYPLYQQGLPPLPDASPSRQEITAAGVAEEAEAAQANKQHK